MRILVAEDDPGLRYQVDAVERGDEAIDQLFRHVSTATAGSVDFSLIGGTGCEPVHQRVRAPHEGERDG